jgi:AraC-like DNA-binding protein
LSPTPSDSAKNTTTEIAVSGADTTEQKAGLVSMNDQLLLQLRQAVEENIKNDQFSVEDLAEAVAYSRSHLHRKLNQLTGQSISQFIRSIRLSKAMQLLKAETATVSEIAYQVGFGSSTYFIKCFTDEYGYSPGEVKRRKEELVTKELSISEEPVRKPVMALEAMHPASSESLIMEIFKELVLHKPSLEKFLLVDEDEGEKVDVRLLAYQMIKAFPWPVAIELRRLFSASLTTPNQSRVDQINKVVAIILKVTTYVFLSDVVQCLYSRQEKSKVLLDIKQYLMGGSPIDHLEILRAISGFFEKSDCNPFVNEVEGFFDVALEREVKEWSEVNANTYPGNEMEVVEQCALLEQTLAFLIKKSAFLVKYKLVKVDEVNVYKSRFKDAYFRHYFKLLNSPDADFQSIENNQDTYSDSHTILLMKSLKNSGEYLNLSPFLIDTHAESRANTVGSKVRQDLYLLHKIDAQKIIFTGTEVNQPCDLDLMPNAEELAQEFEFMFNLIGSES